MDLGLHGKAAFVTGASRGIGRAIAFALAKEGASLAIVARHWESLNNTAKEIERETGSLTFPVAADLSNLDDVKMSVSRAAETLGRIDILVNNAGASAHGTFWEMPEKDWEEAIALKYWGYVRCMREVIPHMVRAGGGSILNIIGIAGVMATPGYTAGGSVNAALRMVTKGAALELAKHNIRVNAVHPGPIETDRLRGTYTERARIRGISVEEAKQSMVSDVALRRLGQPEEIANAALFLVSDCAGYITGAELFVDGGMMKSI